MPPATQRILVVDDDPHIREVIRYALEKEHFQVLEAENGEHGLTMALAEKPDLIVLDVMMPEMNGLDMCRTLRKTDNTPIIFLSSRDDEIDRIIGLEIGGDDYMTKPFSPRELVARVRVLFKRLLPQSPPTTEPALYQHANVQLNPTTYEVSWQNLPLTLTATEYNILSTLMRHPQKVYTRDELIDMDVFKDIVSHRTIDSHVRRLRQKFSDIGCKNVVETVHGFGYKLGDCR